MSTKAALVVLRGSRAADASVEERTAAAQAGCELLHILPHGVLVRGTETQLAQIAERDFRVEIFPDTEVVQAGRFRWRIDEAPPVLEPEWDIPPGLAATWLHRLVQFSGPPIPEWIRDVETGGAKVIDNVGRYGLLVSAPAAAAEAIAALPQVTLVVPYRPAYRLTSTLFEKQGRLRFVAITVFPREAGTSVAARVEQLGGRVERKSTFGPYATIITELDADAVKQVAQLPDVRGLSYLNPQIEPIDELTCQILTAQNVPGYPAWLADLDLSGKDVRIAFADTGISPHPDLAAGVGVGRYKAAVKFTQPSSTSENTDSLGHGTYVAGIAVGDGNGTGEKDQNGYLLGQGVAPGADFVSLKISLDTSLLMLGSDGVADWANEAVDQQASIMSNAWQSSGVFTYNFAAALVDRVVRERSLSMIVGAGNNQAPGGTPGDPVTVPGVAKNAVTVGATASGRQPAAPPPIPLDEVWPSSGRGQAPGQRFLPTVVAPGRMIVSTLATCGFRFDEVVGGATVQHPQHALGSRHASVVGGAIVCAPPTNGVTSRSGTSFAVAHVSGVCALLTQAWTKRTGLTASPALLKAWLINGADDLGQVACPALAHTPGSANCLHAPSNAAGWGRVSLQNMLTDVRGARLFFDEPVTFNNPGDVFSRRVAPVDAAMPMRVTLVWTDPPGDPVDEGALRHDLNLEVESDNGTRFLGNINFAGGFSAPVAAGDQPDHINNVECVYVRNPTGIYTVRVSAPPSFDVNFASQTFALVIENAEIARQVLNPQVPRAPTGIVILMDRSGSMEGSGYAAPAAAAAGLFLDLLPAGDEAAVVSFSTGTQTESGLVAIGDRAAKQAAIAAANAIAFGGCTFMGDAIDHSKQLLATAVNPRREILLLSDGFDNKGCQPLVAARLSAVDAVTAGAAIPVRACAVGPASDHILLQELAAGSGGVYYYAPSEADLNEVYGFIRAELNDVPVVVSEKFTTSATARRVVAPVDRQAAAVTFAVSWADPALQLVPGAPAKGQIRVRLLDPNGRNVHLHATDVRTVSRNGHVTAHLNHPMPGKWQVLIGTGAGTRTQCTATVFVESPLRLDASVNAVKLDAGTVLEVAVPSDVLKKLGSSVTLTGRLIAPAAAASKVLTQFNGKLKPSGAATSISNDGVPTNLARLLAQHRMLRTQGKAGVFKQVGRRLTFRTTKAPGGKPQRVARTKLDMPGSYNLVIVAEGTTRADAKTGKPAPVRRTLYKSILVVEGP